VAITAVARELVGFIWSIAMSIDPSEKCTSDSGQSQHVA
jgi:hypothetical protein